MSTILVTGSRGLLGATLLRLGGAAGHTMIPLTCDITDADALMREAQESQAMCIVHTAALTDIGECEKDPEKAFAVNAEGTRHVVLAARSIGARVIYISSVAVFSGTVGNYRERDTPEPLNVYSESKARGERYVADYDGGTTIRLNLIGIHPDGSRGKNFLEWLFDAITANKDIQLFDDVMMNPLSNWTIADIILQIVASGVGEKVLHISSSDVRSKADVGEMVLKRFPAYAGTASRVSVETIADGVPRPKEMWLNGDYTNEKLQRTMPTLESEIALVFKHFSI